LNFFNGLLNIFSDLLLGPVIAGEILLLAWALIHAGDCPADIPCMETVRKRTDARSGRSRLRSRPAERTDQACGSTVFRPGRQLA
jgi:hypothetical protein